jgi:hypothetical protein
MKNQTKELTTISNYSKLVVDNHYNDLITSLEEKYKSDIESILSLSNEFKKLEEEYRLKINSIKEKINLDLEKISHLKKELNFITETNVKGKYFLDSKIVFKVDDYDLETDILNIFDHTIRFHKKTTFNFKTKNINRISEYTSKLRITKVKDVI